MREVIVTSLCFHILSRPKEIAFLSLVSEASATCSCQSPTKPATNQSCCVVLHAACRVSAAYYRSWTVVWSADWLNSTVEQQSVADGGPPPLISGRRRDLSSVYVACCKLRGSTSQPKLVETILKRSARKTRFTVSILPRPVRHGPDMKEGLWSLKDFSNVYPFHSMLHVADEKSDSLTQCLITSGSNQFISTSTLVIEQQTPGAIQEHSWYRSSCAWITSGSHYENMMHEGSGVWRWSQRWLFLAVGCFSPLQRAPRGKSWLCTKTEYSISEWSPAYRLKYGEVASGKMLQKWLVAFSNPSMCSQAWVWNRLKQARRQKSQIDELMTLQSRDG